ncbi:MAG TPA: adenylate/guanylate cyclase domain-containing protein [Bryobacteraceae bacterium]|jgi:adenylate cyclase|nr:adenylate/guanylate cyclase domain-containing protein [Bryobacteraceae bacterium]
MRSFLIYRPDGSNAVFECTLPVIRIGRGDDNEIILEDPSRSVSRFHAQLASDPSGYAILTDLKSANGTFVNEQILDGPVALAQDDVVRIGPYRLIFRDTYRAPAKEKPQPLPAFEIETAAIDLNELQASPRLLDLSATQTLASSPQLRALELLHEVGVRLARTVTASDVVETSVDLLFRIAGVQRATLMAWDDQQQAFHAADLYARGGKKMDAPGSFDPKNLVLSKTILQKVRQENRPLHIRDARAHADIGRSLSVLRAGIQAAFCSPLTFQGRFLGVLYADNLVAPDAFSADDFRIFTTIAAQTGLALASAVTRGELLKREVEQAAMRLYLSPQVADLITSKGGGVELGGVLQPVTVLFADIRNFTKLSEHLDAREVVNLLNEFFTAMTEVILESGGTLDKYIGDCVMALFGAPVPAAGDTQRAVEAAIAMQREAARLDTQIQIGVGIHSGLAVVGNIGSAQRMQYTAIGDTVNVAARLVHLAAPGQIIVSEDVRSSAAGFFEPLGEVELKGRQQKMHIYSLQWGLIELK